MSFRHIPVCAAFSALTLTVVACGGSSRPATNSPSSQTTRSVGITTSPSMTMFPPSAQTPGPMSTGTGSPCRTHQLKMIYLRIRGLAGTEAGQFELRNASDQTCYITGYATVQMLDAEGNRIPYSSVVDNTLVPTVVVLPVGTAPLASGNRSGHGFFVLRWPGQCESTITPARWQITPPGETEALEISGEPAQGNPGGVCPSRLTVGPIEPPPQ